MEIIKCNKLLNLNPQLEGNWTFEFKPTVCVFNYDKNDRMKEHLGNVGNILLLVGPEKRETKTSGKMGEDI